MSTLAQRSITLKRKSEPETSDRAELQPIKRQRQQDDAPFRFFDLPAELRNHIYAYVAENCTVYLKQTTPVAPKSLTQVSRQTEEELLPILLLHAPAIHTTVIDYDFRHIVTFLNRLTAAELDSLPTLSSSATRKITIRLQFRRLDFRRKKVDATLLKRWWNRIAHPTKNGAMLDYKYTVHLSEPCPRLVWPTRWFRMNQLHIWEAAVNRIVAGKKEGRMKEEAVKICKALDRAVIRRW